MRNNKLINNIKNIANTEDQKRLLSNFFSLSILQIFTYILPLLTLPYLVRVLGVELFGIIMFAQSFIIFLNILVDYGFNISATREVSVYRDNKEKLTEIYSCVLTLKTIFLFFSFLILVISILIFDKFTKYWDLYLLTFLWVIGQAFFPIWYFQGIEKMKHITIVNIISKVIFTILIFIFVREKADYLYVPILNGLGFILGGIYSLYIIRYKYNQLFKVQSYSNLKSYLFEGTQFFLSRLASIGYSNSNTFLAGMLLSPSFVTYYYMADKGVNSVLAIFNPIVQTIYPYLSKDFKFDFFIKIVLSVIFVSCFLMIMGFFLEDWISLILIGSYNDVFQSTFIVMLWLLPISSLYVMLGAPLLLARGFKKEFNMSILYGFFLHLLILAIMYIYINKNSISDKFILICFTFSLVFSKLIVLFIRWYYVIINKLHIKVV